MSLIFIITILIAFAPGIKNSKDVENILAIQDKHETKKTVETPTVQLYYECFCPHCRDYYIDTFMPVVLKLKNYLSIYTYPYGKAQTSEVNGEYTFTCQHGPAECYGNTLHACAIKVLSNITVYVEYNACLLERSQSGRGSDDEAAEKCGKKLNVDSEAIKKCAKSDEGVNLLNSYGVETKKVVLKHVPHICVNGVHIQNDDNLMKKLCNILNNEPETCH